MDNLLRSLRHMRADLLSINDRFAQVVERLHPTYRDSARNLLGYLSLRRHDIRETQDTLAGLGLSSMGRAEAHVLATLNSVIRTVCSLARRRWTEHPSLKVQITRERGRQILREHTEALLGPAPSGRSTRIMVTMPSEAAGDYVKGRNEDKVKFSAEPWNVSWRKVLNLRITKTDPSSGLRPLSLRLAGRRKTKRTTPSLRRAGRGPGRGVRSKISSSPAAPAPSPRRKLFIATRSCCERAQ